MWGECRAVFAHFLLHFSQISVARNFTGLFLERQFDFQGARTVVSEAECAKINLYAKTLSKYKC